jgi:hypothetical protein
VGLPIFAHPAYGSEFMAVNLVIAVNLVRKETSSKTSFRGKRLKASWNDNYLLKLLSLA